MPTNDTIWTQQPNLDVMNTFGQKTLLESLGITFSAVGDNWLEARMPVDDRTVQPFRILHGGASVALAETLGSVASTLCIPADHPAMPVGVEINANHLRSATGGYVTGRCHPVRLGRTLHVWQIDIRDASDTLICVSRLTIMMVRKDQ